MKGKDIKLGTGIKEKGNKGRAMFCVGVESSLPLSSVLRPGDHVAKGFSVLVP